MPLSRPLNPLLAYFAKILLFFLIQVYSRCKLYNLEYMSGEFRACMAGFYHAAKEYDKLVYKKSYSVILVSCFESEKSYIKRFGLVIVIST